MMKPVCKKITAILCFCCLMMIAVFIHAPVVQAEDMPVDSLVSDLHYDEKTSVLTGKTSPGANIYLEGVAGFAVAEDDGTFALPVPDDVTEVTLSVLDVLANDSTTIRLTLKKEPQPSSANQQTTSETEPDTVGTLATESSISGTKHTASANTSSTEKEQSAATSDLNPAVENRRKKTVVWPWVIAAAGTLAVLVVIFSRLRKTR